MAIGTMRSELNNQVGKSYPELMTEPELIEFLRIDEVSNGAEHGNIVKNLKRMRDLPCIHICRRSLYPREAIRRWIDEQVQKEIA